MLTSKLAAALLLALEVSSGASLRDQIEAEWERHDESRMAQMREPGLVRLAEEELVWPGLAAAVGERLVPRTPAPAPAIDGRLDDACWRSALRLEGTGEIVALLAHDGAALFAGITFPAAAEAKYRGPPTALDASGAVDGVKNGLYAFHTGLEPNPWWQVDLGSPRGIARIVVYNRLDYAPGLHNADNLLVLVSNDRSTWSVIHDTKGKHFGGVAGAPPLAVRLDRPVAARYVRLQLKSDQPIFFHLDEVEIYGADDVAKNIALGAPAEQSSLSIWSRGGPQGGGLLALGAFALALAPDGAGVTAGGSALTANRGAIARAGDRTTVEVALPRSTFGGGFPESARIPGSDPVRIGAGAPWLISLPEGYVPRFGLNALDFIIGVDSSIALTLQVTAETVVFTPRRAVREIVFQHSFSVEGATSAQIGLNFTIMNEGPATLLVEVRQGGIVQRQSRCAFIPPVAETLWRAERLRAEFGLERSAEFNALGAAADELRVWERGHTSDGAERRALYRRARWAAREIAFRNPLLSFKELLFVKRFTQETYPDVCLNHMPWVSRPGGDICILSLDRPHEEIPVRALLNGALGPGHVRGIDLWWDGTRVVFGYAKAKSDKPPQGWLDRRTSYELRRTEEPIHIFEIGIDGRGLRQITSGEWSDLDPTYAPNGDIAFASERCGYSLQCNEYDKDETSCNLYIVRPDGSGIRRLSVTKDGDYLPHTLADGTIGYTRWEYQERGWAHIQSIWNIRPDGTGADAVFKQHFNDPWALEDVRSIPGTHKLVAIATGHHTLAAGPVVVIDPTEGINNSAGIRIVTPGLNPPEGGMSGRTVREGGVPGKGGFCMTPWPLSERFFLVSRNYGAETEATGYALYLADVEGTFELIYRDPAISCFIPIPLAPRPRPPILPDTTDPTMDYATLTANEVWRGADGIAPERIRYLRVAQRMPWPYDNTVGGQRYEPDVKSVMINWTPARVLGTVPVERDGSAHFRVPVDKAVYFQLLDENFMELRRMRSFISFQPGEMRSCTGCHETRAAAPANARPGAAVIADARDPEPPPWGAVPLSFLRVVQPVLDAHCVRCHAGMKPAGGFDFSGGLTASYNRAYDTILANKLVARSNVGEDARVTMPLRFGSHKSKLVEVLKAKPHTDRAQLSQEDWLRLITWIDANGPYHDGFINKRLPVPPYDLPADRALAGALSAVHARRCASCHDAGAVSRLDWIDLRRPAASRFLAAPLAKEAGGEGKCATPTYRDRSDADYQAVLKLVEEAARKAWERPRRDLMAMKRDP